MTPINLPDPSLAFAGRQLLLAASCYTERSRLLDLAVVLDLIATSAGVATAAAHVRRAADVIRRRADILVAMSIGGAA